MTCYSAMRSIEEVETGIRDNFSYLSTRTYAVTPHKNRLGETVLMWGYSIPGEKLKIKKFLRKTENYPYIIPVIPSYVHLSQFTILIKCLEL